MDTFLVNLFRLMFATLLVFGAFRPTESYSFTKKPPRVVRVLEGENKQLIWEPTTAASEYFVSFSRLKIGGSIVEQIASRTQSSSYEYAKDSYRTDYTASLPATLLLKEVKRDEEYVYTARILNKFAVEQVQDQVTVEVVVPPKITIFRERELRLTVDKNYTLTCNASGDPHPNITWTKDGVPESQFNATGYHLHLVRVQRKDAGAYRCTASNGYGQDATSVSIVGIQCPNSQNCQAKQVGITIRSEDWKDAYNNKASVEYKNLESKLLSAILSVYTKNPNRPLYRVDVANFRSGSVYATVELLFENSADSNLNPLRTEMNDGKLGSFTVDRTLDLDPTTPPTVSSTVSTTGEKQEPSDPGARGSSSGLTESEMWGIIGGCIAFVLLIVIIIVICCICKKRKTAGGASKGKSYSEADGYRMNRQPPPSGLSTASPAYVEARQYAPVSSARKQDDQSKPPLNYADLSFNNSSGRQPPPYSGTEYSEMSPEKRPPPAGGQQGEGGGFELWC